MTDRARRSASRLVELHAHLVESLAGAELADETVTGLIRLVSHTIDLGEHPARGTVLPIGEVARHRHPGSWTRMDDDPDDQRRGAHRLPALLTGLDNLAGRQDLPLRVQEDFGPVSFADHIRMDLITLVALAHRHRLPVEARAWAEVTRTLATIMGERRPGHSIEVRIPPYAAVQLGAQGEGPVHRRGTPPTVVETDAASFLALCLGRIGWQQAVDQHVLTISGVHALQVASLLPLFPPDQG